MSSFEKGDKQQVAHCPAQEGDQIPGFLNQPTQTRYALCHNCCLLYAWKPDTGTRERFTLIGARAAGEISSDGMFGSTYRNRHRNATGPLQLLRFGFFRSAVILKNGCIIKYNYYKQVITLSGHS